MPPQKLLSVLIVLATVSVNGYACYDEPEVPKPKLVPEGWVTDYDYKTHVMQYLRLEYEKARGEGLNVYVFLYADWCKPCMRIRTKIQRVPALREVFDGRRIVMMQFSYINCLVERPLTDQVR